MAVILEKDPDPRLVFRASDVRAMLEAGILDDERRYEVLDGEIVPMQAHNPPHMRLKRWILDRLYRQLGEDYWIDSEPSFYLEEDGDYTVPDIVVYPRAVEAHLLRGPDALLVIEVADSSFRKDRERKGRIYAKFGLREYWVVQARTLKTHVFTGLAEGRYGAETVFEPDQAIRPGLVPGVSLTMGERE